MGTAMNDGLIHHADGKARCWWAGQDPLYVAYHDTQWGVPDYESRALFEKLILDGFQAGLSWITILRKRENFIRAFAGFDPQAMARFDALDVERLMNDAGIVRNRAKITGAIASAKAYLDIEEKQSFSSFLWQFVEGKPLQNTIKSRSEVQSQTRQSLAMSKALKSRGFKFCGPTITYAFMQATGMVNDHLTGCHCHQKCAEAAVRS